MSKVTYKANSSSEIITLYNTFHNIEEWIGVYMNGLEKLATLTPAEATVFFALASLARKNKDSAILLPVAIKHDLPTILPGLAEKTILNKISILIKKGFLLKDGRNLALLNPAIARRGIQAPTESFNQGMAKLASVISEKRDGEGVSYVQSQSVRLRAGKDWYFRCSLSLYSFVKDLKPNEYKMFLMALSCSSKGTQWFEHQDIKKVWDKFIDSECTDRKIKALLEALVEAKLLLYYGEKNAYTLNINIIHNDSVFAMQKRYNDVMNKHKIGLSYRRESQERKQERENLVSNEPVDICRNMEFMYRADNCILLTTGSTSGEPSEWMRNMGQGGSMGSRAEQEIEVIDSNCDISVSVLQPSVSCVDPGETRYDIPPESFGIVVSESGRMLYSTSPGNFVEDSPWGSYDGRDVSNLAINSSSTKRNKILHR